MGCSRSWWPMNTFWRPGVALMNRLTYPRKFALISLLFILPLGLVLALMFQDMNVRVTFAREEQIGTQYLRPLRILLEHSIQDKALKSAPDERRRQFDQDFQELAAADQQYGAELQTTALFETLRARWRALNEQVTSESDAHAATLTADIHA